MHDPQVPPLLPLLLPLELLEVPLSSSSLPLLLPEELVLLPEDDEVLPLELLLNPLSRVPGVPASPKSNPLPDP